MTEKKVHKIIKYVLENNFITNKEARELLGLADSTAKGVLKEMVNVEILIAKDQPKARKCLIKQ